MIRRLLKNRCAAALVGVAVLVGSCRTAGAQQHSVARIWDEQLLTAISKDTARPTVHARNLFHLSTAMYDAWSAFDSTAKGYLTHEKMTAANVETARAEAISYAAYGLILHRFVEGPGGVGPGKAVTLTALRNQMTALGYDPDNRSTVGNTPAALGNRVAAAVVNYGLNDGARESQNYALPPGQFAPVNEPLTFDNPGNVMADPNRWQPLRFLGNRIDQFGTPILESVQKNLTPFWGDVKPFAMTAADKSANGVYHDQGTPRQLGGVTDAMFKQRDVLEFLRVSSQLDPAQGGMIDISPATRGNTPNAPFTESYAQVGYSVNPYTGQPYAPEMVNAGDFGRVVAEFWADGPKSTAPPGHWNELANDVSDKMDDLGIAKKIGGVGPTVNELEWDVKKYFALNGGLHDAAVAAWNHKGVYDSARPVSFIRYMGSLGQSTDPNLTVDLGGGNMFNTYNVNGLPLEPGLVEVITPATTAAGQKHEHLAGNEGKIAIFAWQGAVAGIYPFDDPADVSGCGWILSDNWMPYQLSSFVTPPFPGFVSGHSTYSRTGAEVLTALTGSEFFPGGIFEYDITQGSGLRFEYGPSTPLKLQFATYFDASDQASLSRLYGGIHPPADDFAGRRIGHIVGPDAFNLAMQYFAGVPEPSSAVLVASFSAALAACRKRIST